MCERDAAGNRVRTLENEAVDARRRIGECDEKSVFLLCLFTYLCDQSICSISFADCTRQTRAFRYEVPRSHFIYLYFTYMTIYV